MPKVSKQKSHLKSHLKKINIKGQRKSKYAKTSKTITQIDSENLSAIVRSIEDFKETQNPTTSNHIRLLKHQEIVFNT